MDPNHLTSGPSPQIFHKDLHKTGEWASRLLTRYLRQLCDLPNRRPRGLLHAFLALCLRIVHLLPMLFTIQIGVFMVRIQGHLLH